MAEVMELEIEEKKESVSYKSEKTEKPMYRDEKKFCKRCKEYVAVPCEE
jgi:hypothetical protein